MVWAIAAVAVVAAAADGFWPYVRPAESLFVAAVVLTAMAVFVLMMRRILVATAMTAALLVIVGTVSAIKQDITDLPLHAYDLVTLAMRPAAQAALWATHPLWMTALLAAMAASAALAAVAWRFDGTRVRRWHALAAIPVCMMAIWFATLLRGERTHDEMFEVNSRVALFFASWTETSEALWRGRVVEAAATPGGAPFQIPAACHPSTKPPHIILIHEESVAQPSQFPGLRYDKSIDSFFHSHDGRLHKLRVETYGGASWLTEFSVLTGLSAHFSGGLGNFLQQVMAGKVRDTLPQALARCGYRNVALYPMLRIYLGINRFFAATGIHEILDANDQRATSPVERDHFYFNNALGALERHLKTSQQPMFLFVETMAAHGSYDYAYMPEEKVPGGGPGTPPRMHEYLRRLAMAKIDYDAMRADLERRFPNERFLIVHYGDHQPTATQPLLGFDKDEPVDTIMRSGKDAAFITYYAVDGVRYAPPPLPAVDVLDVPYLGAVILEAAGLPLSDVYRERRRLMALCEGHYRNCAARAEILKFHRRMIDSGLMDAL
ncbi:MAG: sulfatase-like hydrolase/transferase [Xanthobacteraceae bacterium]|nr:sulfatase-like hydrolase/transferase [Xanthobacteraceae bacterium]